MRAWRLVLATAGLFVACEAIMWAASHLALGDPADRTGRAQAGRDAVLVLGYGNRGRRANIVNRWRVRAGIRSRDGGARSSVLVLCGGAVAGARAEGDIMADYARDGCGYRGPLRVERSSSTTAENIRNAATLVAGVDTIAVVSDPLHALRGRRLLWMTHPDLAARLRRGGEYRFGELTIAGPVIVIVGVVGLCRSRRGDDPHRTPDYSRHRGAGRQPSNLKIS